jgi:uncharacterized protein (TIGR03067 family)
VHATLLITALAVGAPALKDPPKKELKIEGEWVVESQISAGRPLKSSIERRYIFSGDGKWTMTSSKAKAKNAASLSRTYVIDATTNPASIDMKTSSGLAQPNMVGIIKVEGDTLTLCYSRSGEDRPKTFESPEDSSTYLIIMKRAKAKD